jgi:hypothetical protein
MQLQRKVIFVVALFGSFLILGAVVVSTLAFAADPGATVTVGDIKVPPGGVVRAPIMVQNVTALGGGVINITYNSSVVHVTGVTEGGGNALTIGAWSSNNSLNPGSARIAAYSTWLPGQSGDVTFAYVTYQAVGQEGLSSPLTLGVDQLFNVGYSDIPRGTANGSIAIVTVNITGLDTGQGGYPSIAGIHKGVIIPNRPFNVSKLFTYPAAGTGGHTEYIKIGNGTWNTTGTWSGYTQGWQTITFNQPFMVHQDETYYYEIRTGSYPQIVHQQDYTTLDGSFISCTSFEDLNGNVYEGWIPAIRLYSDEGGGS